MKSSLAFLLQLRVAIAGALALGIAGIFIAIYCQGLFAEASTRNAQVQVEARKVQAKLDSVYIERKEINDFLPRYNALRAIGAIDDERRLDWIERLAAVSEKRGLPRLIYTIAPRAPYARLANPAPALAFQASRMKLEASLIHEGEFIDVIASLREPPIGVLEIQSCVLKRIAQANAPAVPRPALAPNEGNLTAMCEIDWITLVENRAAASDGTAAPQPEGRSP